MDDQRLVRMLEELGPEGYDEYLAERIGRSISRSGTADAFRELLEDRVDPRMLGAIASSVIAPLVREGLVPPLPWPVPLDQKQYDDRLMYQEYVDSIDSNPNEDLNDLFNLVWRGYTIRFEYSVYRPDIDPEYPDDWDGNYDYNHPEVSRGLTNYLTISRMAPDPLHNHAWPGGWIEDADLALISEREYDQREDAEYDVTIHISRDDGNQLSVEEYRRIAEIIWPQVENPTEFPEEMAKHLEEFIGRGI